MGILTYYDNSYTVDHAVKGADFIHGYDAEGIMIVSFEGITDFSGFTYDGTYLEPADYLDEDCNDVKFHDSSLKKADGTVLSPADYGAQPAGSYAAASHNQAASTITAGTLAGQVNANATAAATVGTAQVRDIYAGTSDMTAGTSALTSGVLYLVYE